MGKSVFNPNMELSTSSSEPPWYYPSWNRLLNKKTWELYFESHMYATLILVHVLWLYVQTYHPCTHMYIYYVLYTLSYIYTVLDTSHYCSNRQAYTCTNYCTFLTQGTNTKFTHHSVWLSHMVHELLYRTFTIIQWNHMLYADSIYDHQLDVSLTEEDLW